MAIFIMEGDEKEGKGGVTLKLQKDAGTLVVVDEHQT
jgi:hypothetical protein